MGVAWRYVCKNTLRDGGGGLRLVQYFVGALRALLRQICRLGLIDQGNLMNQMLHSLQRERAV